MRVIAGIHRGRRLAAPPGRATRPTPDRVREALFNIVGQDLSDQAFLDLYSGSGAVAIEAHSRGAARVACVESDRGAAAVIRQNVETCRAVVEVMAMDVRAALRRLAGSVFDVIFADPPYAETDAAEVADLARIAELLAPDGVVVLEHRSAAKEIPLAGLEIFDRRRYGDTGLTLYRLPESARKG